MPALPVGDGFRGNEASCVLDIDDSGERSFVPKLTQRESGVVVVYLEFSTGEGWGKRIVSSRQAHTVIARTSKE